MPTLRLADSAYPGRSRSAFGRAGAARPLDIWIDTRRLRPSPGLDHLLGFVGHDGLRFVTTTPVPGADLAELEMATTRVGARIARADGHRLIGGGPIATWEALVDAHAPTADPAARELLLSSALLATVADRLIADVFVTDVAFVRDHVTEANGVTVEGVLALIGLYLRMQDDFTVHDHPSFAYNRGLFYWLLARELVPSWGPAWRALVPTIADGTPTFLNGLGHALIVRVDAALRARDRAHLELQLPQDNDAADEFLFALDALIVTLDSCFDILARVVNQHFGLGSDASARWRDDKRRWPKKLAAACPPLATVIEPNGAVDDMTALLGHLRKSIHGVPLQTIANQSGGRRTIENLLVIPPGQESRLAEVFTRRGGADTWGVRPGIDQLQFVDPRLFVEAITRHTLEAIDATVAGAVGPDAERDRLGDWDDTPEVRHQLRALSGTVVGRRVPQRPDGS